MAQIKKVETKKVDTKKSKTLGTKGAAVKAPEIEFDDESDEDEEDEPETKGEKKPKRSPKERLVIRATRTHKSVLRMMHALEGSDEDVLESITKALDALENVISEVRNLKADWKPARTAREVVTFSKNALVEIGAAYRDLYTELLEPDELDDMRVLGQHKKVVAIKTSSGSKMFIPAQHLKVVSA